MDPGLTAIKIELEGARFQVLQHCWSLEFTDIYNVFSKGLAKRSLKPPRIEEIINV